MNELFSGITVYISPHTTDAGFKGVKYTEEVRPLSPLSEVIFALSDMKSGRSIKWW